VHLEAQTKHDASYDQTAETAPHRPSHASQWEATTVNGRKGQTRPQAVHAHWSPTKQTPPLPTHVQWRRGQLGAKVSQRKEQPKHALCVILPRVRAARAGPLAVAQQPAGAVKEVEAVDGHAGQGPPSSKHTKAAERGRECTTARIAQGLRGRGKPGGGALWQGKSTRVAARREDDASGSWWRCDFVTVHYPGYLFQNYITNCCLFDH